MSTNNGHNHIFTPDDIRRYVQGEMSAKEMHTIERASLDDPFLADAIEGYEMALKNADVTKLDGDRADLQQRLEERLNRGKKQAAPVIRFRWWQAAAAGVIIGVAGILNYNSTGDNKQETVVSEARDNNPAFKSTMQTDSARPVDSLKIPATGVVETIPAPVSIQATKKQKPSGVLAQPDKQEDVVLSDAPKALNRSMQKKSPTSLEKLANEKVSAESISAEQEKATEEIEEVSVSASSQVFKDTGAEIKVLQGKVSGVSTRDPNAINNPVPSGAKYYFQGQVFSADKMPLSNANPTVPRQNKIYQTDNNGYFTIPSNDSIINFNVSAIGKQAKSFTLDNNLGFGQMILPDKDAKLSEVVVVGYGSEKKKNSVPSKDIFQPVYFNAAPVNGWPALQDYFTKNISPSLVRTPHQATDISFRVAKDGKLSSFRITRSISPEHDKEAMRLLSNGPAWKLLSGKKADVTVTIIF